VGEQMMTELLFWSIISIKQLRKRSHILLLNLICWLMDNNTDDWFHINYQVVGII